MGFKNLVGLRNVMADQSLDS